MTKLPIKTDWSKIPGPNFFGPMGEVKDIDDWLVLVKGHVLLQSAVQLNHMEANDPMLFEGAKKKAVRRIEQMVFGDINDRLHELRNELRFALGRDDENLMKKYDAIIDLVASD